MGFVYSLSTCANSGYQALFSDFQMGLGTRLDELLVRYLLYTTHVARTLLSVSLLVRKLGKRTAVI